MKLLLLPGMDGTGELFAPLLRHLPADIEPIVVRYPFDPSMGYAELLEFVRPRLPVGEAFAILGESFSGPLAIQLAARQPPGLIGVLLCATFVTHPVRCVPRCAAGLVSKWLFPPSLLGMAQQLLLGCRAHVDVRRQVATALATVPPAVLAARLRAVLKVDVRRECEAVSVPIHYLQAAHDRLVPARNLVVIRHLQPTLTASRLPGPHLLLQTLPVESAQIIGQKLREWAGINHEIVPAT